MGESIVRIHGVALPGIATEHDGRYVVEWDAVGPSPWGQIVTTDDPTKAKRFANITEVQSDWAKPVGPRRPDGKPNRPLTVFTMSILSADPCCDVAQSSRH